MFEQLLEMIRSSKSPLQGYDPEFKMAFKSLCSIEDLRNMTKSKENLLTMIVTNFDLSAEITSNGNSMKNVHS